MDTLLLNRGHVAELLGIDECINAVETTFGLYAEQRMLPPKVLGLHCENGGLHIKAGILTGERSYFVTKLNANFPGNPKQNGLPTIQGVIVVCDATNGRLLALMDSIEITILRTGAATGVAAKYLAGVNAKIATICGCGTQGRISARALMKVRKLEKLFAFDIDDDRRENFRQEFSGEVEVVSVRTDDLHAALSVSDIVVTCTPSKKPFISAKNIAAGTFIAAVGADSEDKCELFPELLAANKVVTDITEQCVSIGELHHAIDSKLMIRSGVHAELGEVIARKKPGRMSAEEIIIFDSTGTALQDVAAATIVYEKAIAKGIGGTLNFAEQNLSQHADSLKKYERDIRALRRWFPFK